MTIRSDEVMFVGFQVKDAGEFFPVRAVNRTGLPILRNFHPFMVRGIFFLLHCEAESVRQFMNSSF